MLVSSKSILSSFIWKYLERSSVQIVSFIVSIILARILSPEDYGSIALVLVFINISSVFIEGGLNSALIQKKNCTKEDYSSIFYISMLVALAVYILIFFFAPFFGHFYRNSELCIVLRVIGIGLFFNVVNSIQNAYVSKQLLFRKLFVSSFAGVLVSAIIGISMAYYGYGIWALVVQYLVSSFSIMVVMWFTVKWRPVKILSIQRFKSLFQYGWKIMVTNMTISLFTNIRSLIIGKVFTPSALAFFDRGKQFPSVIMDNIIASIQSVMFPVLSYEQDSLIKIKSMMRRSITISSYLIFPLLTGLLVISKPLVIVLLTEKWIEAIPFIRIFCIALILMPIQNINMVAIKSIGYSDITLKLELVKKILEVSILIITVFISVKAIAWGVVVYNFSCLFINLYPCKKLINYSYKEQLSDICPILFCSIAMGVGVYCLSFIPLGNLPLIVLSVVLGLLLYLSMSMIFKLETYQYIVSMIKNLKNKKE